MQGLVLSLEVGTDGFAVTMEASVRFGYFSASLLRAGWPFFIGGKK